MKSTEGHRNSFNAIRLLLAWAVLTSHSWPLSGAGDDPSVHGQSLGAFAVVGFFAISGYLISESRSRLSLARFAWHRFLRIFPGYWAMLIITAFVLAPAVSVPAGERWTAHASVRYLLGSFTTRLYTFSIEGTLLNTPYGSSPSGGPWNGSIWTLYLELLCYAAVGAVLLPRSVRARSWPLVVLLAGLVTLELVAPPTSGTPGLLLPLAIPFAAGSALWGLRDRHIFRWEFALVAAALTALSLPTGSFAALGSPALGYLLLWAGQTFPTGLARRNDISYGVYIYAFPLQQVAADLGVRGPLPLLLVTSALVVPIAFASWRLVERPALRAKSWNPLPPRLATGSQLVMTSSTRVPEAPG